MANTKSAIKKIRVDQRRKSVNDKLRSGYRQAVKDVMAAVEAGDKSAAEAASSIAYKKLDKAAKRNTIHPNTAARKKSAVARAVDGMSETKKKTSKSKAKKKK